jgi:hypothetical protein
MSNKKLNVDAIRNDLEGSAFSVKGKMTPYYPYPPYGRYPRCYPAPL